ncbi:hypothetical protein A9Z42_0000400 [Trichoderma parareesei]|uniref:MULE transposase domain-containing protein n=1 Tax=Trichoderma parareesei TaxID=858221 RepID=A0A2H2ZZH1_TRIPA|nr:hypothetical protein A9Z42_0000400 [Trichoderma parareesei]
MASAGIAPVNILTKLRRGDEALGNQASGNEALAKDISRKDVVNFLAKHRQDELNGRSPLEWLYDQFQQESGFFFRDERDENGRLTRLFMAPQSGSELLRDFPEIMLFDSTYKTNRFHMPLFNICSTTSLKKSFQVATVFLSSEKEGDYSWAIRQLAEFLKEREIPFPRCVVTDRELALMNALNAHEAFHKIPHILCHWHVNMNVISNTKKHFSKPTRGGDGVIQNDPKFEIFIKEWHKLVTSKSEAEFNAFLIEFKTEGRHPKEAVDYVLDVWIDPWQEKLVRCFVDRYPHFGRLTTSIVESSHASLKRFLQQRSTGDLKVLYEKLQLFWTHQAAEARLEAQRRRNKVMTASHFIFSDIRFQISPHAVELLQLQLRLVPRQGSLGSWWEKSAVDQQQRRSQAPLEPRVIQQRGRPRGAVALQQSQSHQQGRGVTSTRRMPSEFEIVAERERVEAIAAARMPPPSTAPALSTTDFGIQRLQQSGDAFVSGQPRPRAYQGATQQNLPTPSPTPNEPEFPINESEFDDHFDALVRRAQQLAEAAPQ